MNLDELKVYVTPNIAADKFVLGVNGNDYGTAAAVYAPLTNYKFALQFITVALVSNNQMIRRLIAGKP